MASAKQPAQVPTTSAPKPVRLYLILLFIAVLGIGFYLILKQYNEDLDTHGRESYTSSTPTPATTATPTATPAS